MTTRSIQSNAARIDDDQLLSQVHAFQGGDEGAFDAIYGRLWRPVVSRAAKMGLADDEAEEVAQKALVRVYLYIRNAAFDRPQRLWGWVFTVATREVYKHWRKRRPDLVDDEALEAWASEAADESAAPLDAAAASEAHADVQDCLAGLDEKPRVLLLAVLAGELTFRQAARNHGLTLGQFKHRYEKALAQVRACMEAKGHVLE